MAISFLVFEKLLVLFLLTGMGLLFAQQGIFTKEVTLQLSKLLTKFVAPSLFVSSFIAAEFSWEKLSNLGLSVLAAFLILGTRLVLVHFLYPAERNMDKYAINFANVGFMGTPLALAVGGKEAVFYISAFVIANQLTQWTYGIYLISGDKSVINLRSLFINPATIGTVIGIFFFMLPMALPQVVTNAVDSFATLNTPLSTLVLGSYFYKASPRKIFLYPPAYQTAFWRLLGTSALSILLIWLLPIAEQDVRLALSIASTAPAAMNTALLSQVYGGDYEYGSRLVLLTTTLSIVTIPLTMGLAGVLYL
ncbi:AEC family transporter [Streptococcus hillyeri]|uniref:Permease n=1 Tax=Streptococcus hillyeri TaxID=2282420 RepID=A0A3L9DV28_9STRE|nr:AEC family transporter [Streptococcus hillyeri]RLY04204.1 permease [Streptococcus hillyeri]